MSEKSNKKKVKLNVIDVLIIFLVIALVGTISYRVYMGISNKTSASRSQFVITFECNEEYNSMIKYLTDGKAVYFSDSGKLLGHMYAPDEKGASYIIENETAGGDIASSSFSYDTVPLRGFIKMSSETVKASVGSYYSIGDTNLSVGSRVEVYTNEAEFTLTVKSIG